jgi:hypothetical protein
MKRSQSMSPKRTTFRFPPDCWRRISEGWRYKVPCDLRIRRMRAHQILAAPITPSNKSASRGSRYLPERTASEILRHWPESCRQPSPCATDTPDQETRNTPTEKRRRQRSQRPHFQIRLCGQGPVMRDILRGGSRPAGRSATTRTQFRSESSADSGTPSEDLPR